MAGFRRVAIPKPVPQACCLLPAPSLMDGAVPRGVPIPQLFYSVGAVAGWQACASRQTEGGVVAVQLSGERIITMEWMDGCKLTDLEGLRDQHLHSRDVAIELLRAFAKMTFVDGFGMQQ